MIKKFVILSIICITTSVIVNYKLSNFQHITPNQNNTSNTEYDRHSFSEPNVSEVKNHTLEDSIIEKVKIPPNKKFTQSVQLTQTQSNNTPTGTVDILKVNNIKPEEINLIDLSGYNLEIFVFRWKNGVFKWGTSDQKTVPALQTVEVNDDLDKNGEFLVSDLITFDNKPYLYIQTNDENLDLEIHLINPSRTKIYSASAPSNYCSGSKYSTLNIIPREEWSGDPNINDPRRRENGGRLVWDPYYYNATRIVLHHTATANGQDPIYWMKAIYNYHAYSCGWGDIGYNYLIDQYGNIYEGKLGGEEAKGYHAGAANANSIGISMLGSFTYETPTAAAQNALKQLIAEKATFHNFSPNWHSNIFGHRDFMATACPGNAFYNILPSIINDAKAYKDNNFSNIKSVVSTVEESIANGNYEENKLILIFDNDVTIATLGSLIPFYNDQPVAWTGIQSYTIKGKRATLMFDYSSYGTQTTEDRLKNLYKLFWLDGSVKTVGLNFGYSCLSGDEFCNVTPNLEYGL